MVNLILDTKVYNDLFDELLVVAAGDTVNDTVSNMALLHYHHLMEKTITPDNRQEIKRNSLLNLATQVTVS